MDGILIFSDASYSPRSTRGVGAFLAVPQSEWDANRPLSTRNVKTKLFREPTIARLELSAALWALDSVHQRNAACSLSLFTDSQTIANLPQRRIRLEANGFKSKRTDLALTNADLYKKFFILFDNLNPTLTWIKGHTPQHNQSRLEHAFTLVDRAARQRLREIIPS